MYFLRVDMVALDNYHENWLLNELEYFGNADIHLECMGSYVEDLFDHLKVVCFCCFIFVVLFCFVLFVFVSEK